MPRILVVDDDPLSRAVLADAVRKAGHEVVPATSAAQAIDFLTHDPFALVIADVRMPDIDGFELIRRMHLRGLRAPVVLCSMVRDAEVLGEAARRGVRFEGFLPKPVNVDALGRVLERWCAEPLPFTHVGEDSWSGEEFLPRVSGSAERFPPCRVLFLAHRLDAAGALFVSGRGQEVVIGVRGGKIIHAGGVPDLLGPGETGDLASAVGAAVAGGHSPGATLDRAAADIGRWAVSPQPGRTVRWEPDFRPPPGVFPLPLSIPRMLHQAHGAAVDRARIERRWGGRVWSKVRTRIPDDSPEARWGLDATSLRVLRLVPAAPTMGDLLTRAVGNDYSRRADVQRAIEFLYYLGLIVVEDIAWQDAPTQPAVVTIDPAEVAALREAHRAMEGKRPAELLGLTAEMVLTPNRVSEAFRKISQRFHPDKYFKAPSDVRILAESCFSQLNAANSTLQDPASLEEENRRLDAARKGLPYVTDGERRLGRSAARRGEVHLRNKEFKEAHAQFAEAWRLDALSWPHEFAMLQTGWLARILSGAEVLERLPRVRAERPEHEGEVLVLVARIHDLEGRNEEAIDVYRQALQKHPENRDALRAIRLHESRAPVQGGSIFGNLLTRFPKRE